LRIVAITDLHRSESAALGAAETIAAESPDALFVVGDISHGDFREALRLLEILVKSKVPVYFVPGNMDSPRLSNWSGNGLKNLHGRCIGCGEYALVGLGGSINTPFNTPFEYTEEESDHLLNQAVRTCREGSIILVTHSPPKDTKLDLTRSGIHAGSHSVRRFIETKEPILVVCGHIHEAQGIDRVADTILVNPGPAYHGGYARIELNDQVQVGLARFRTT
jgi:Icc-related predicted phosphoesterase